ncbi:alpha/beta fold hydrolase [Streptomyces sp. NPDC017936]|uniref:alpha/beta fold hydrolase n=1 Tax=Streptomyces sp. NPDC017936 TaxID=3365016 RepID=UPI00378E73D1
MDVRSSSQVRMSGPPDGPVVVPAHGCGFRVTGPDTARVLSRVTFLSDDRTDPARVAVPTLVARRSSDANAPPQGGALARARSKGSRLVPLDTTGHRPRLGSPEETTRAIAAFARTLR